MSASQSPVTSLSTLISGGFPAMPLVRAPGMPHAARPTAAQNTPRTPAHTIPRRPPGAATSASIPSPQRIPTQLGDESPSTSHPSPARTADTALHAAARPKTDAALLEQMVALRRAGKSLRQIGRQTGRCMEGVRQALMRYEQARSETPAHAAQDEDWHEPLRDPEPLPAGHPIATQAIWRGLERWRDVV